jgi:site-specific recombinase XerD
MKNRKKENTAMKELAIRNESDIKEMARILADFPPPGKWTQAQKAQAVQFAALLDTAQKINKAKTLAGIDYIGDKETFLKNAGKTESRHTRTAYRAGIERLESWTAAQGIDILELTPAQADNFIYALKDGRASASVRLDCAAASSFFTWLHRQHNAIENPFRGSKARPAKRAVEKIEVPTAAEIKIILSELPAYEKAAAAVMALRGLRVGALANLSINGARFTAHSKGKDITGTMPAAAIEAIKAAGLPLRSAFSKHKTNTLQKRVERAIKKLQKDGKIKAPYSAHDLRHYFAITEYRKNKDIHKLCKLLGHCSIQITENYLKGLGEAD